MYATYEAERRQKRTQYIRAGLALWAAIGAALCVMRVASPATTNLKVQTRPIVQPAITQIRNVGAAVTSAATAAAVQAPAAMALVDERLNGEGTGLPLGINDPILFWVMLTVFTTIWALWATSVKEISNNDDPDSGVGLD